MFMLEVTTVRTRVALLVVVSSILITLSGSAAPVTTLAPLFSFSPKNVPARGTLEVVAWRFDPTAPAAAVSLVDVNGAVTTLDVVPIANGWFRRQFTLPDLVPGIYHVVLQD